MPQDNKGEMHEIEIWVLMDVEGNYEVGNNAQEVSKTWKHKQDESDPSSIKRLVCLKATMESPTYEEMQIKIPATSREFKLDDKYDILDTDWATAFPCPSFQKWKSRLKILHDKGAQWHRSHPRKDLFPVFSSEWDACEEDTHLLLDRTGMLVTVAGSKWVRDHNIPVSE